MEEVPFDTEVRGVPTAAMGRDPWLAAYTRPRHEEKVKQYWIERGIETFLPCRRVWRRWSDRRRELSVPLFPSYVFVRIGAAERARAVQAPGFLWFVRGVGGPVSVDESELEAVRRLLASGLEYDPLPAAQLGDEVEIVSGSMRGVRGRLERKGVAGVVLLVSAIHGLVRVTLPDPSWVAPVGGQRKLGDAPCWAPSGSPAVLSAPQTPPLRAVVTPS